jgi:quercetin dioxygenase-like cupin family protein
VRRWNLREIETPAGRRSPVVLHSGEEARAVLVALEPGEELGVHQVKEHTFVMVVDGSIRIATGNDSLEGPPGTLFVFDPDERRTVSTHDGARVLLVFAPWPGEGHFRGEEQATKNADR